MKSLIGEKVEIREDYLWFWFNGIKKVLVDIENITKYGIVMKRIRENYYDISPLTNTGDLIDITFSFHISQIIPVVDTAQIKMDNIKTEIWYY